MILNKNEGYGIKSNIHLPVIFCLPDFDNKKYVLLARHGSFSSIHIHVSPLIDKA